METLSNYLDNLFKGVPQTQELARLRSEIYINTEEKYEELIKSGKSEYEAIGIIISEFGSIDELLGEKVMAEKNTAGNSLNRSNRQEEQESLPLLKFDTIKDYLGAVRTNAKLVGSGVFLIICGVALMMGLYGVFGERYDNTFFYAVPLMVLLLMISIAVGIFIFAGSRMGKYDYFDKGKFRITDADQAFFDQEGNGYHSKSVAGIIAGVCLCIIAPIILFFSSLDNFDYASSVYTFSIMLLIIAIAVFLLIYFGEVSTSYKKLLKKGNYSPEEIRQNKLPRVVATIVFPLATVVFLGITLTNAAAEEYAFMVFVVAAVLYGIFVAVYKMIRH
jgi:hypothetical protein